MKKTDRLLLDQAERTCREVALNLNEMADKSDPEFQAKRLDRAADKIREVLIHGSGTGGNGNN
jgi:hypothetical protein